MPHQLRRKHNGDYVWHKGFTLESAEKRFWSLVDKSGECWLWMGTKSGNGYGKFSYGGEGEEVLAHRFSFFLHHGRWPTKPYVCHRCDNRPCVRPSHLFEGSPTDNNDDMTAKGRARRIGLELRAKSTPQLVQQIREMRRTTDMSMRQIGAHFGVGLKRVESALYKWKHISKT